MLSHPRLPILVGLLAWLLLCGFALPPEIAVTMPSNPTDYYCDLDAAPNGIGSSSSPWNSMANALSGLSGAANPWRLNLRGTEYIDAEFFWTKGGASGNEGVITAWGTDTATIRSFFRFDCNYVIVDGKSPSSPQIIFEGSAIETEGTVRVNSTCDYVTLWCIEINGRDVSVTNSFQGSYTHLYNARIHDHTSHNVYISGNAGHNNMGTEIRNCIVYNAGRNGIQVNPHETSATVTQVVIAGNAVHDNGESGIYLGTTQAAGTLNGADIYNNLCWNNANGPDGDIHVSNPVGSFSSINVYNNSVLGDIEWDWALNGTFRNNNYGTLTGTPGISSDNASSSPYASTFDADADFLHITASNNGYDTNPPVSDDYFGTPRDANAPDIGAHEYVPDQTPPDPGSSAGASGGSCFLGVLR